MVTIQVSEALAAKLENLAKLEGRAVEAVIETAIEGLYPAKRPEERTLEEQALAMESIAGILDDDISDLSETVDESVGIYLQKKHK